MDLNVNKRYFYVYLYLDTRKENIEYGYEPFYVGKGKGKRDMVHINTISKDRTNLHKTNRIKAIIRDTGNIPKVIRIATNLSEEDAYQIETDLIKSLGRVDIGSGCLLNLTDGGDGCRNMSDKGRLILSEKMRGDLNPNRGGKSSKGRLRPDMVGQNNHFFGKYHDENSKKKISDRKKKAWAEEREKLCKSYELISPDGQSHIVNDGLRDFANRNDLSYSMLRMMLRMKPENNDYIPNKGSCIGWIIREI